LERRYTGRRQSYLGISLRRRSEKDVGAGLLEGVKPVEQSCGSMSKMLKKW